MITKFDSNTKVLVVNDSWSFTYGDRDYVRDSENLRIYVMDSANPYWSLGEFGVEGGTILEIVQFEFEAVMEATWDLFFKQVHEAACNAAWE